MDRFWRHVWRPSGVSKRYRWDTQHERNIFLSWPLIAPGDRSYRAALEIVCVCVSCGRRAASDTWPQKCLDSLRLSDFTKTAIWKRMQISSVYLVFPLRITSRATPSSHQMHRTRLCLIYVPFAFHLRDLPPSSRVRSNVAIFKHVD